MSDPRPDPRQFLGKRVRVTLGEHVVQTGRLLGFGDGGDFELEGDDGLVYHAWPMLGIEAAGEDEAAPPGVGQLPAGDSSGSVHPCAFVPGSSLNPTPDCGGPRKPPAAAECWWCNAHGEFHAPAGKAGRTAMTPEQMLREFHASKAVHGGWMPEQPTTDIPERLHELRQRLLDEETDELAEAVRDRDIVKIADALGDIVFVAVGTAVTYGIPFDAVLAEVFRSNMTKVNTPAEAKLVKGPDYEPPRIAALLGVGGSDA